jgi:hypothetical protein
MVVPPVIWVNRSEEDQFLALRENNSLVVNENFTLTRAIPKLLTWVSQGYKQVSS